MSKGIKNNPATGRAEQHPCRRLLTAAVTVAGPLLMTMPAFAALNCTTQPSCTDLGYSKTSEANCESYVLCPFDTSYKACVKYGTSEADCSGYPLSSCPDSANCSTCGNGTDVKYKIDSCKDGFYDNNGTCVANACSGYNLSYCPDGAVSCSTCLKGTTTRYKANGCYGGYTGDNCHAATCLDYGYILEDYVYDTDEATGYPTNAEYVCKSHKQILSGPAYMWCYDECKKCSSISASQYDELYYGTYGEMCVFGGPDYKFRKVSEDFIQGYQYGICVKYRECSFDDIHSHDCPYDC